MRPGAILLTSGPDDENVRVLINPAEDAYRVYAAAPDEDVSSNGLLILPRVAPVLLDGTGRGTISLPEDRPVAELFGDAALLPAQHVETIESDALSSDPTSAVPDFRLRVTAAGEEVGWIPEVEIQTAETVYVAVRWADGNVICETKDREGVVDVDREVRSLTISLYG